MTKDDDIETLIGRSSLGEPAARKLRARTPRELVEEVLARAQEKIPRGVERGRRHISSSDANNTDRDDARERMSTTRKIMIQILERLAEKHESQPISGADLRTQDFDEPVSSADIMREAIWMLLVRRAVVQDPKHAVDPVVAAADAPGATAEQPPADLHVHLSKNSVTARITAVGERLLDELREEERATRRRLAVQTSITNAIRIHNDQEFNRMQHAARQNLRYEKQSGPLMRLCIPGNEVISGFVKFEDDPKSMRGRPNYDVAVVESLDGQAVVRVHLDDVVWAARHEFWQR